MITIIKTLTYAAMHITVAIAIAYLVTGSIEKAVAIGILEPVVQTFFFYFHENVWNAVLKPKLVKLGYN